jgi:hypothetical protein
MRSALQRRHSELMTQLGRLCGLRSLCTVWRCTGDGVLRREAEMTLRVLPEGLATAAAAVEALTARLAATHAAAATY